MGLRWVPFLLVDEASWSSDVAIQWETAVGQHAEFASSASVGQITLAPQRAPKDQLFRILEPSRAYYLGTWGARVISRPVDG